MSRLSAIKVCLDTNNFVRNVYIICNPSLGASTGQLPTHSLSGTKILKGVKGMKGRTRLKRSCGFSAF